MSDFRQKVREICTTHKRNGSGYYNLSEEQLDQIVRTHEAQCKEDCTCHCHNDEDDKLEAQGIRCKCIKNCIHCHPENFTVNNCACGGNPKFTKHSQYNCENETLGVAIAGKEKHE